MFIDTSVHATWNHWCDLALAGVWLVLMGLIAFASSGGCGNRPDPAMPGSISLAWSITDLDSQPTTCVQANAQSVALRLRNRSGGNVVAAAFPCANSPSTAQFVAGVYDIAIELDAADGTRLATAPDQTGITITSGQVQRLLPATFVASTQSRVVISLATPATTNCQPVGMNGAGITGTTITLVKVGDGCAAVTFIRSLGTTQRGTYTVNCSSPSVATCVENNETLTTSLAAGAYTIHVRGKIGAVECWQRDDTLEVPPPGKSLTRTLDLTHQTLPGC
jgi:hypothetical protein